MTSHSRCEVCKKPGTKACSACHTVSYCSVEHQKAHWKSSHKSNCRVYLLKRNDIMGRYIVASRDLPAGTLVMDEPALIIGPKQDTLPICLGCHKRVGGSYLCSKCSIPVCSMQCEMMEIHAKNECKVFSTKKAIKITNFNEHHPLYQCILTLRCLCLKEGDPGRWEKLNKMEHHNDLRKNLTQLWERNEVNTVKFLREIHQLDFDRMTIHSVLGYADINAFEIRTEGVEICGLFPEVALMAHDCISNTHHSITDDNRMQVRTTVQLKKGDMITTTYTHTLDGTLDRRKHIKEAKLFDCACNRCSSPSEMGTNFSSVKCPRCPLGYLMPLDSLKFDSDWGCSSQPSCMERKPWEDIVFLVTKIKDEIEGDEKRNDNLIPRLEAILEKYSGTKLHPQHYLMVGILHTLSQFYGRTKGWTMPELSLEQLTKKETACRKFLAVLDVTEPGMSRIRGSTLYELHAAIFFSAQKRYQAGQLDKEEVKVFLKEVLQYLETSMEILSFDSPLSFTGRIASSIPDSIEGVKQIMEHFCS